MARTTQPLRRVAFHTDWLEVPVLLDAGGVAIVLGLKHEAVRKALAEGRLPGVKVLGNSWRIRKDLLMAHLGYLDWEIERYGFGMNTPAQVRGYDPVIRDDFSTALHRSKEGVGA